MRAKAILLAAEGLSNTEIAERLASVAPGGLDVAKTLLRGGAAGARGETAAGSAAAFFPRRRWPRSRRWRASCRPSRAFRSRAGRAAELAREAVKRGIVATVAAITIWRWLREDAIRPWNYRSWIFPRDPKFAEKAGRILDLYEGRWEGQLLEPGDFVVCADEKPSIQARARKHPSQPAKPGGDGQLVEHEYERKGALCYLAAWDVRRAKLFDRCAPKDGIEPFDQLVEQFMTQEPYSTAQRVFVIVDNGSAHRGQRSIDRLQGAWPNLRLVHTPVHASWVNQAEIYFSVAQRKVLQPNNFPDLDTLEQTLLAFGRHYEQIAQPFEWKFTRKDLHQLLERLEQPTPQLQLAA